MKSEKPKSTDNESEAKSVRVLAIVAHSDDETIGMGGTIARHVSQGHSVYAACMTNGVGARLVEQADEKVRERSNAAHQAAAILGFEWLQSFDFPDNAMDTVSLLSVVQAIEKLKEDVLPDIIYTHNPNDLNIDHQVTTQAVLTAFRPQAHETYSEIRAMEVSSATDYAEGNGSSFVPHIYTDIDLFWSQKRRALSCYSSEIRQFPHSRSQEALKALATHRGCQVGVGKAECFQLLRRIER